MSHDGDSSDSDGFDEKEQEERRQIRMKQKAACEHLIAHKQDLRNVNSNAFPEAMDVFRGSTQGAQKTRELQFESMMLKELGAGAAGQWNGLCDKSARFNWVDFVDSVKAKFTVAGEPFVNWEKAGGEARMLFNTVPSFSTMVGPIHKEEKFRKMAVRRARGDNSEVVTTTGQVIENHEEDGNDEATNARVDKLLGYLTSIDGQFDLLRTLVDPSNPVQSVENFFDFAYLHKVIYVKCLSAMRCHQQLWTMFEDKCQRSILVLDSVFLLVILSPTRDLAKITFISTMSPFHTLCVLHMLLYTHFTTPYCLFLPFRRASACDTRWTRRPGC
jgi:hypothetical protein